MRVSVFHRFPLRQLGLAVSNREQSKIKKMLYDAQVLANKVPSERPELNRLCTLSRLSMQTARILFVFEGASQMGRDWTLSLSVSLSLSPSLSICLHIYYIHNYIMHTL